MCLINIVQKQEHQMLHNKLKGDKKVSFEIKSEVQHDSLYLDAVDISLCLTLKSCIVNINFIEA